MMNMIENKACDWFEAIKADLVDRLEEKTGEEMYTSDVGFVLTICENNTGSWYCSTWKAREEIGEHWHEFGLIAQYMCDTWEDRTNPMLETELFHVRAMICLYERLFEHAAAQLPDWDDEVTIDESFINSIREALEDVTFDDIF